MDKPQLTPSNWGFGGRNSEKSPLTLCLPPLLNIFCFCEVHTISVLFQDCLLHEIYPGFPLIFLKRSLFPVLIAFLFFITEKAFLSLYLLWNSAFWWVYLSFFPLGLASLAIFKAYSWQPSSPSCIFFSWGWFWSPLLTQCCKTPSIVSSGTLSDLILWICHFFPTPFNLSLNLAIRHLWSEPQSAPGLAGDFIELLHLWLQTI